MTTSLRPACVDALRRISEAGAPEEQPSERSATWRAARRHIEMCPICASLVDDAIEPEQILAALAAHRPPHKPVLRIALGVIAAVQCAIAVPWLFGVNPLGFMADHVASEHLTRDGAIGVVVGVAGLTTALVTRHGLAMLVMGAAAIGMQLLSFAIDEDHDRVHPLFELSHLLVPVILALIAVFALRRPSPVDPPDRGPGLRVLP
jgi:hypothetical protein